ncbi:MAG: amidohydrolase family protein [Firmicutes bacterium]|nr:amidohydrolase family protein [Bacillota bacterium]
MSKKILTAMDVEKVFERGEKEIITDEDFIITGIAREKAEKLGVLIKNAKEAEAQKLSLNEGVEAYEANRYVSGSLSNINLENKIDSYRKDMESLQNQLLSLTETVEEIKNIRSKEISNSNSEITDIYDLLVKNGQIVIPEMGVLEGDIVIKDGFITSIEKHSYKTAKRVIDAKGLYVLPGIVDPHVHMGIFAPFESEIDTETISAIIGGITTIGCFFGGKESYLHTFPSLQEIVSKKSMVDIIPHFVIMNGKQMSEIPIYVEKFGVKSFKLYMNGIPGLIPHVSDSFIFEVFEVIKHIDDKCIVCIHAENPLMIDKAMRKARNKKSDSLEDWAETHPDLAEEEAIRRAASYAEFVGIAVYFVHISGKRSIKALKDIKFSSERSKIYVETTSPYLTVTVETAPGVKGKMEPPFRSRDNLEALWEGVKRGIIDTIGTDNVTITLNEKKVSDGVWGALPGYPALATHLPIMLDEGVNKGRISIEKLAELMCKNPAKIFGVYPQKGTLLPGSDADLVLIDLNKEMKVDVTQLGSRSDFSLYEGRTITGWPVITIKSGEVLVEDMKLLTKKAKGKVLFRK